jgi:polyisoprenyl-phosphate glycosyltransferase
MTDPLISLVIPLYNESQTLPMLVSRIDALCHTIDLSLEVVLIDDGSTDNTAT